MSIDTLVPDIILTDEYQTDLSLLTDIIVGSFGNDQLFDENTVFIQIVASLQATLRYYIRHLPDLKDIDQTNFLSEIQYEVGFQLPLTPEIPTVEWLRENKRWNGHKTTVELLEYSGAIVNSPIEVDYPNELIFYLDGGRSYLDGATSDHGELDFADSKLSRIRDGVYWAEYTYVVKVLQAQNIVSLSDLEVLLEVTNPAGMKRFVDLYFMGFVHPTPEEWLENEEYGDLEGDDYDSLSDRPYGPLSTLTPAFRNVWRNGIIPLLLPVLDDGMILDSLSQLDDFVGDNTLSHSWLTITSGSLFLPPPKFVEYVAYDGPDTVDPVGPLVLSSDGAFVYVACYDLGFLDLVLLKINASSAVVAYSQVFSGMNPQSLFISHDGSQIFLLEYSGSNHYTVVVVNSADLSIAHTWTLPFGLVDSATVSHDDMTMVFTTGSTVYVLNLATGSTTNFSATGGQVVFKQGSSTNFYLAHFASTSVKQFLEYDTSGTLHNTFDLSGELPTDAGTSGGFLNFNVHPSTDLIFGAAYDSSNGYEIRFVYDPGTVSMLAMVSDIDYSTDQIKFDSTNISSPWFAYYNDVSYDFGLESRTENWSFDDAGVVARSTLTGAFIGFDGAAIDLVNDVIWRTAQDPNGNADGAALVVQTMQIPSGGSSDLVGRLGLSGILLAPDNNLWFTAALSNKLIKMNTSSVVLSTYIVPSMFSRPLALCTDGVGIWGVENAGGGKIFKSTVGGIITEFDSTLGKSSGLIDICFNSGDGNLYALDNYANNVLQITPLGVVTVFNLTGAYKAFTAICSDGTDLWGTEAEVYGDIFKCTTAGVFTEYHLAGSSDYFNDITYAFGYLWVLDPVAGAVLKVNASGSVVNTYSTPNTTNDITQRIVADVSNNLLWITSIGINSVADAVYSMDLSGTFTTHTVPANSGPSDICIASNGHKFVVEEFIDQIQDIT